nr:hypothetical protein [uncultured Flavobacterium sp.]
MTNSDTLENNGQDDQNFQNEHTGNQGQQKTSSPAAHRFTENAPPDYSVDVSAQQTNPESGENPEGHTGEDGKIPDLDSKSSDPESNRYNSENLDSESGSGSKDITQKDIEEDLIHNDSSEGFETDMDVHKNNEAESDRFETIEPDQDNPVQREFEIGHLGNEELKEDELTRDETGHGTSRNIKPSQRKF